MSDRLAEIRQRVILLAELDAVQAHLAACEQERDRYLREAELRRIDYHAQAERATKAEARLAKAEEALRLLREAVHETFTENRDGGWKYRIEPAERLIALAGIAETPTSIRAMIDGE